MELHSTTDKSTFPSIKPFKTHIYASMLAISAIPETTLATAKKQVSFFIYHCDSAFSTKTDTQRSHHMGLIHPTHNLNQNCSLFHDLQIKILQHKQLLLLKERTIHQ